MYISRLLPALDERLGLKERVERFSCQQFVPEQNERTSQRSRSPMVNPAQCLVDPHASVFPSASFLHPQILSPKAAV